MITNNYNSPCLKCLVAYIYSSGIHIYIYIDIDIDIDINIYSEPSDGSTICDQSSWCWCSTCGG